LTGAVAEAAGEGLVGAVAGFVTIGAAEVGVGLVDHAVDAILTALRDGANVLSDNSGHEGRDSEDELHVD